MWISIFHYNIGEIEIVDVTKDFAENEAALIDNEKAVDWIEAHDYCASEVSFMLTDECPTCTVNDENVELNQ